MKKIAIYGASGHGKVVADIALSLDYKEIVFVDDGENNFDSFEDFTEQNNNIPFALAIGDNYVREKVYQKLISNNIEIVTLVHPKSVVSTSAKIGTGTVVMAGVVINADAFIGRGTIINTSAVIEHDNKIGDFVHISPNASLAGNVSVDKFTHIGIGSSIIQNISIGKHTIIGAGSVIVDNIPGKVVAYGVPAKVMKENCIE